MKRRCPICKLIYDVDPGRLKYGRQTTCSRKCSYRLRSRCKGNKTLTCPCGKTFSTKVSKPKKFCSKKCRYELVEKQTRRDKGTHRTPPTQYKCYFCRCTFLSRSRNKHRAFCSRKCYENQKSQDMAGSNNPMYGKSSVGSKKWRQQWVIIGSQKCFFRSSWEKAVAYYLNSLNVDWRYEYKRYVLSSDLTYTPDFFIMDGDRIVKIIEVKGWVKEKDRQKITLFKKQFNIPIEMWSRKELMNLNLLDGKGYGKIN